MMSNHKVTLVEDSFLEFNVMLKGPVGSELSVLLCMILQSTPPHPGPYEGGVWKVHVEIPDGYPYKSPSIGKSVVNGPCWSTHCAGFTNRIFHPNIDEASGTVCLDVINQTWSPMYGW